MIINTNLIYNQSLKLIDDSYHRLVRIRRLPQGFLTTKKGQFYWQYYHDDRMLTKKITRTEWQTFKKKMQQRQKLLQINKKVQLQLKKYVKLLALFNKELSFLLNDELIAYRLDSIPINERSKVMASISVKDFDFFWPLMFQKYFKKWLNGKISARTVIKHLLVKTTN